MPLSFCKFHGFGNDYVVINDPSPVPLDRLAREMCDRHTGVGADGLAVLREAEGEGDRFCEIINPDGGFAQFSGNGTRCAAAFLYYRGVWSGQRLRLETRSGLKEFELLDGRDGVYRFRAGIGQPAFASDAIPMLLDAPREAVVNEPIAVDGTRQSVSAINVGNPVACVYLDDLETNWRAVGRELESHPAFPQRTNVVFIHPTDRSNIDIRIWERGAGETAASGTCATAAAVMSAFLLKTERTVSVHSPGGTTEVEWRPDGEIMLTGRAELVFCGEWPDSRMID